MNTMFRQGDVLIRQIENPNPKAIGKPVERDNGRIVLAYGEFTGHAHAISNKGVEAFLFGQNMLLRATNPVVVRHEEHDPIVLEAGDYEVIRQREYTEPTELNPQTWTRSIED